MGCFATSIDTFKDNEGTPTGLRVRGRRCKHDGRIENALGEKTKYEESFAMMKRDADGT